MSENGIAVTDLSAQLWCEKQLEFSLEKGRLETKELLKGKERHRELHEEVATLIKVEPKTLADSFALSLHNTQVGLKRLTNTRRKLGSTCPLVKTLASD